MKKTTITLFFLSLLLIPLTAFADEGIPLQKDVILNVPILAPEDLPEEVTFTLYDTQNGLTPLGSQTFTRGQYTVDFEFSQSDGVTRGQVARVNARFTNKLDLMDDFGESIKPKEISILKCEAPHYYLKKIKNSDKMGTKGGEKP
jgi:hypothetical protein